MKKRNQRRSTTLRTGKRNSLLIESLEKRCLLAVDPVLQLKLDITQDGQSILDDQRQFVVQTGERFDLEFQYDDLRPYGFANRNTHLGAFAVYADILAENAGSLRPVLTETQIISVSESLIDANGGYVTLAGNGRSVQIPILNNDGESAWLLDGAGILRNAIESANGLNFGEGSVTVFEALRDPRDKDGTVGSGEDYRFIVRFVGSQFESQNVAPLSVNTSAVQVPASVVDPNTGLPVKVTASLEEVNVFVDPQATNPQINPKAFRYNLDARVPELRNTIVYGNLQSGTYDANASGGAAMFDEVGGTGPVIPGGIRAYAESLLGSQSNEFTAYVNPISNVEVFSIRLEAVAPVEGISFTLERADSIDSALGAYGIDTALTPDQVEIDLTDDPTTAADDRFGMVRGRVVAPPSVIVAAAPNLQTTESGGNATFTIALGTVPSGNVTIDLSSTLAAEGTVSPAQITFTPGNALTPQTITVTGVDDVIDDGDQAYQIITSAAVSDDRFYDGFEIDDVSVTNLDNDTAGITLSRTSGLQTTEAGGNDSFTIVLNSQPAAEVIIGLSSSKTNEATIDRSSVTFTPENWDTPQRVEVQGQDDFVVDGDATYEIITAASTSNDPKYNQINVADVSGSNKDDDVAAVVFSSLSDLKVSESGDTTATFTVNLATVPTSQVTLLLSSDNTSAGTVSPSVISFTPNNALTPVTVTVSGVDDNYDDGDTLFHIVTSDLLSSDPFYNRLQTPNIDVTNIDDDTAGVTLVVPDNPVTSEANTADKSFVFTIALDTIPTSNVSITISTSDPSEGLATPSLLTFTPTNALTPRSIVVTGADDTTLDGDISYQILVSKPVSNDPKYNSLSSRSISVVNIDDERPATPMDYGDAPSPYPTRLYQDGARHLSNSLYLGTQPSLEVDGKPNLTADGDNADDGVTFLTSLVAGQTASKAAMQVNASGAGKLDAWIDFNADGDWLDPGEKIAGSVALTAGINLLPINIPAGAVAGATFARFRISEQGGLLSTGEAPVGEVEDYAITLIGGTAAVDANVQTLAGDIVVTSQNNEIAVSQNGFTLFSAAQTRLNQLRVQGTANSDLFNLSALSTTDCDLVLVGGDGNDRVSLAGSDYQWDPGTSKVSLESVEQINLAGGGAESVVLDPNTISQISDSTGPVTIDLDPTDTFKLSGQWQVSGFASEGGRFYQVLTSGAANVRLSGAGDWTNPVKPLDVNNSGRISAIDALQILNQLTRRDVMTGASGLVSAASLGDQFPGRFYDVNNDGKLTPLDALLVINALSRGESEAELDSDSQDEVVASDPMDATVGWADESLQQALAALDTNQRRHRDTDQALLEVLPELF